MYSSFLTFLFLSTYNVSFYIVQLACLLHYIHLKTMYALTTHGIPFFVAGKGKFSCTFYDTTSWNYVNQDDTYNYM